MSVWTRLFGHTPQSSAIENAYIEQSRSLVEIVKQQQDTLDRIVNAKYDRPFPVPAQPVAVHMPFPMNDQGDVTPLLSIESDRDFLKAVGAQ